MVKRKYFFDLLISIVLFSCSIFSSLSFACDIVNNYDEEPNLHRPELWHVNEHSEYLQAFSQKYADTMVAVLDLGKAKLESGVDIDDQDPPIYPFKIIEKFSVAKIKKNKIEIDLSGPCGEDQVNLSGRTVLVLASLGRRSYSSEYLAVRPGFLSRMFDGSKDFKSDLNQIKKWRSKLVSGNTFQKKMVHSQQLFKQKKYQKALKLLTSFSVVGRNEVERYIMISRSAYKLKRYEDAVFYMTAAYDQTPSGDRYLKNRLKAHYNVICYLSLTNEKYGWLDNYIESFVYDLKGIESKDKELINKYKKMLLKDKDLEYLRTKDYFKKQYKKI